MNCFRKTNTEMQNLADDKTFAPTSFVSHPINESNIEILMPNSVEDIRFMVLWRSFQISNIQSIDRPTVII